MTIPWPLPVFNFNLTNFKASWSLSLSQANFPSLGNNTRKKSEQKKQEPLPPFVPDLPPIIDWVSVSYPPPSSFVLNAENWEAHVGPMYEQNDRPSCLAQKAVKLYIRRVSSIIKVNINGFGMVVARWSSLDGDISIGIEHASTKLVVSAHEVIKGFLVVKDPTNGEIQHFYKMVEKSIDLENMDLHPYLQHTQARLMFPVNCIIMLEEADDLAELLMLEEKVKEKVRDRWDKDFNNWFIFNYRDSYSYKINFGDWVPNLGDDEEMFRDCWNGHLKSVLTTKTPSQMVRFARALPIHLNNYRPSNQKKSEAEMEYKYSEKYYYVNMILFEYMIEKRAQLTLLQNPRI